MSKLNELISTLCPEGVIYKELSECVDYIQPKEYIVNTTDYSDNYETPVLTPGQSFILGYTNERNGIYDANKESPIILFDDFTTSNHWVDFNFKVKSSASKILISKRSDVNFKYIYHIMKEIKFDKGEHGRKWISKYSKIRVPIPPIEVQNEIVKILDNFTTLFTNLIEELLTEHTKRNKQYHYYRDSMLTFDDDVKRKKLNEVFEIQGGYTPSKNKREYWIDGEIPWYRMDDIRKNGRILKSSMQYVTKQGARKVFKSNSIILSTTATIGEHALIQHDFIANQQFTIFTILDDVNDEINVKYLYYYFYIISKKCKINLSIASFPSVNMRWLKNLEIPIPSIDIQDVIVEKLDLFENLISDLNEGIPAEIEMRQKQYEYYRHKLLNFKEFSYE